jgi:hypothetical protein
MLRLFKHTVIYNDWLPIYIYTAIVLFEQSKCIDSIFTIDLVFYDFSHRIRKEGDVLDVKINQACTFVINPSLSKSQNTDDEDPAERFQYDIFISRSRISW